MRTRRKPSQERRFRQRGRFLLVLVLISVPVLALALDARVSRAEQQEDEQAFPNDRVPHPRKAKDPLPQNPVNGERMPEDNPRFDEPLHEKRLEHQHTGPTENPHFDEQKREKRLERERSRRGNPD